MRVGILGPFVLQDDGRPVSPGGSRQRAVLAYLALHAHQVVPAGHLLLELWGEDAPASAANALQAAVSRLRKAIPAGRLVTQPPGYLLVLQPDELDLSRFTELAASGRYELEAGRARTAATRLREALAVWRGPALADFRYEPFAQAEISRLEEARLACWEDRIEADLAAGGGGELVAEVRSLVGEHPLRERLRGQLIRALYRSGRQSDALAVFRDLRRTLRDELGIDPSPELVRLERAVLRHDPSLLPGQQGPAEPAGVSGPDPAAPVERDWAPAGPLVRRPVTVLAVELLGGPRAEPLDPEAAQPLLARVERLLQPVLDRYGGRATPAQGNRLTAAFGVHAVHEDDALRAARAAVDARAVLRGEAQTLRRTGWELSCRFAVATDEALVAGPAAPASGFSGPAPGQAARLLADAAPWQILLDARTAALTAGATRTERLAGGRSALVSVHPGARPLPVRLDGPLVGREPVIEALLDAVRQATRTRRPVLVPVIGEAGVGKTRTALELADRVDPGTTVLTGRCLPYGDGITFWPLRDLVDQVTGSDRSADRLVEMLADEPDAAQVADRLGRPFGTGSAGTADATEIVWATRRLLEVLGRRRPLVVVLEDLHWAEPTFLDLVEAVVRQAVDVPLTLLGLARPELLERRPSWRTEFGERLVELTPLGAGPATELIEGLAGPQGLAPDTRARILEAAGGNPLYLEQLIAAADEPGGGLDGRVPPSLQALLAARLDRLGPAERIVLSCAAVIGRDFSPTALAVLLPEPARPNLDRYLHDLAARGMLQRRTGPDGQDQHTFRHVLIQQAAFRAVAKTERARLHEAMTGWIQADPTCHPAQRTELLAFHLEQAALLRRELRPFEEDLLPLLHRAGDHLRAAGAAAHELGDAAAAAGWFERAAALLPVDDPARAPVLTSLGAALVDTGRLDDAAAALDAAVGAAGRGGRPDWLAHARVQTLLLGLHVDPGKAEEEAERTLPDLRRAFTEAGDELGLCRAWMLQAAVHWNHSRSARAEAAWQRAADHARRVGDRRHLAECLCWLASAALWGPTPVEAGIARCDAYAEELAGLPTARAEIWLHAAGLHALRDDLARADELLGRGIAVLEELASSLPTAVTEPAAYVALISDRPDRAETLLRREYESLRAMGEKAQLSTVAALMARILVAQGPHRHAEAEALVAESWAAGGDADPSALALGTGAMARILSARGDHGPAERLARAAVDAASGTDLVSQHADTLVDLAQVLAAAGRPGPAAAALGEAAERYRAKGDLRGLRQCDRLVVGLRH
jgi:DNA-binding SARP family transcriptional activator/tetratricopeptide (TPR) repeat protein